MRTLIPILSCLACVAPAIRAAAPAPPATQPAAIPAAFLQPSPETIDRLIRQLSDESWRVRDEAQFRLVRLGESVRPRLEQLVAAAGDEEARSRAFAILQQLERERTTGVSRILLNARQAAPADVFAELARQAHAEIHPARPDLWTSRPFPRIDLELAGEPFWAAVLAACAKSNLHIAGQDNRLVLADEPVQGQSPGRAPHVVSGAFLVAVTHINRNQSVDLNNPNNIRRACNLQLLVFPEPKLQVLQASHAATLAEAVDEKGNSLLNPAMSQYQSFQPMQNLAWTVQCYLMPPAEAGRKIARLRGTVSFIIQTRGESGEIEDVASQKNVERITGGRRFVLKELARAGDDYIVRLTVYRMGWEQNEWNTLYNTQMFRLYDADGQLLRRQRVSPKGATAESMELEIYYQRAARPDGSTPGEPVRLAWNVAIETEAVDVPFDFKDLPLP